MKRTVKDLKVAGKVVFVRVDFNVPLDNGEIRDDNRIVEALPTIKYLVEAKAKVVLLSHMGKVDHKKPEKVAKQMAESNLAPVALRLGELLKEKVFFSPSTSGDNLAAAVKGLRDGQVLLVQNTRYEKGETDNDTALAQQWADLADAFVMDAFGSAHREHSSTYGIADLMNKAGKPTAIGFLVQKEVEALTKCVKGTAHPYVAILGGLKVSDKIKVIEKLLEKTDKVIIGGAMSYTFYKAMGFDTGRSPVELDQLDFARKCLEKGKGKIILPLDVVVADDFMNPQEIKVVDSADVHAPFMGMDIGPKSRELFAQEIKGAGMIFWNGPAGVFERKEFDAGTRALCEAITSVKGAFTVIGGGDSAAAAAEFGYKEKFSHVSTGGGASLEMIENEGVLPGIEIISEI